LREGPAITHTEKSGREDSSNPSSRRSGRDSVGSLFSHGDPGHPINKEWKMKRDFEGMEGVIKQILRDGPRLYPQLTAPLERLKSIFEHEKVLKKDALDLKGKMLDLAFHRNVEGAMALMPELLKKNATMVEFQLTAVREMHDIIDEVQGKIKQDLGKHENFLRAFDVKDKSVLDTPPASPSLAPEARVVTDINELPPEIQDQVRQFAEKVGADFIMGGPVEEKKDPKKLN
jgi:hypothetical protein